MVKASNSIDESGSKMTKAKTTEDKRHHFSVVLHHHGVAVNLKTHLTVLKSIKNTDKITLLAYRVALMSLGASLISIVSSLIR